MLQAISRRVLAAGEASIDLGENAALHDVVSCAYPTRHRESHGWARANQNPNDRNRSTKSKRSLSMANANDFHAIPTADRDFRSVDLRLEARGERFGDLTENVPVTGGNCIADRLPHSGQTGDEITGCRSGRGLNHKLGTQLCRVDAPCGPLEPFGQHATRPAAHLSSPCFAGQRALTVKQGAEYGVKQPRYSASAASEPPGGTAVNSPIVTRS